MGGNALSQTSIRLPAGRYHVLEKEIVHKLAQALPGRRVEAILAYAQKPDFGDMDVLIESGPEYDPYALAAALQATEVVRNSDVTSIGVQLEDGVFQVDLIKTRGEVFDFASRYFSFNDMGNLLGRVAHKAGAKFGHAGLNYPLRDEENDAHMFAEVMITSDFAQALNLLGYDASNYERRRQARDFANLEEIFRYVVSSPYVNQAIYLLENVNHKARIRDIKRPTYTKFLQWLQEQPQDSIPAFPWGEPHTEQRQAQRQDFLRRAFMLCPDFEARYQAAFDALQRSKRVRQRLNGKLASEVTGLRGKELGEMLRNLRTSFASENEYEEFCLRASDAALKALLRTHAQMVQGQN